MTDELTLREKVGWAIDAYVANEDDMGHAVDRIATILEDTCSPAHMRVAKELRGE